MRLEYKTFSSKKKRYDDDDDDDEKEDYIDRDINKRAATGAILGGALGDYIGDRWDDVHRIKKLGSEKAIKGKKFLNGRKAAGMAIGALGTGLAIKGAHELIRHQDEDTYLKHSKRHKQTINENAGVILPVALGASGGLMGTGIGYATKKIKSGAPKEYLKKAGRAGLGGLVGTAAGIGLGLAGKGLVKRHNENEINKIDKLLHGKNKRK